MGHFTETTENSSSFKQYLRTFFHAPYSVIHQKQKSYFTQQGLERYLSQASQFIFGILWPWPLTSWSHSWSFHALAPSTTCVSLRQNRFNRIQNIMFTSLLTDEWDKQTWRTNRQENITPPASLVDWQTHKITPVRCRENVYDVQMSQ